MEFYQEITLLPTVEFSMYALWSKVYENLHLRLAEVQHNESRGKIGIAFPDYRNDSDAVGLGRRMRLLAPEQEALEQLEIAKALHRYMDYVHISSIRRIPRNRVSGYAVYCRFRFESSRTQKARRYARRHDISYQEALSLFPLDRRGSEPPYLQVKSLSNGNSFRLYINKKDVDSMVFDGFSAYGLSDKSSVPEF